MKFITIFLSVQEDEECLVLDGGHRELGHVSLIRQVEGDTGAAASRHQLQERAVGAAQGSDGSGERMAVWRKAKRQILLSTADQGCVGPEL